MAAVLNCQRYLIDKFRNKRPYEIAEGQSATVSDLINAQYGFPDENQDVLDGLTEKDRLSHNRYKGAIAISSPHL